MNGTEGTNRRAFIRVEECRAGSVPELRIAVALISKLDTSVGKAETV